jgi:hypothetical protein
MSPRVGSRLQAQEKDRAMLAWEREQLREERLRFQAEMAAGRGATSGSRYVGGAVHQEGHARWLRLLPGYGFFFCGDWLPWLYPCGRCSTAADVAALADLSRAIASARVDAIALMEEKDQLEVEVVALMQRRQELLGSVGGGGVDHGAPASAINRHSGRSKSPEPTMMLLPASVGRGAGAGSAPSGVSGSQPSSTKPRIARFTVTASHEGGASSRPQPRLHAPGRDVVLWQLRCVSMPLQHRYYRECTISMHRRGHFAEAFRGLPFL